jgi:hypothetical protein
MSVQGYFGEGQIIAPPQVAALTGAGLVICPLVWQGANQGNDGVAAIYRLAYERAQAALRPSWYEQLYRGSPN